MSASYLVFGVCTSPLIFSVILSKAKNPGSFSVLTSAPSTTMRSACVEKDPGFFAALRMTQKRERAEICGVKKPRRLRISLSRSGRVREPQSRASKHLHSSPHSTGPLMADSLCHSSYLPHQTGLRFSRNAPIPSCASSAIAFWLITSLV